MRRDCKAGNVSAYGCRFGVTYDLRILLASSLPMLRMLFRQVQICSKLSMSGVDVSDATVSLVVKGVRLTVLLLDSGPALLPASGLQQKASL